MDCTLEEKGNLYVNYVFQTLPAPGKCLEKIKAHLQEDEVCKQIMAHDHMELPDYLWQNIASDQLSWK